MSGGFIHLTGKCRSLAVISNTDVFDFCKGFVQKGLTFLLESHFLTHSLLKLPISMLVISLNNISKCGKNSEDSIAFGETAKFKPLHKTDFS